LSYRLLSATPSPLIPPMDFASPNLPQGERETWHFYPDWWNWWYWCIWCFWWLFLFFSHFSSSPFSCNELWIFMSVSKRRNFSFQAIAEQPLGGLVFRKPLLDGSKLTINRIRLKIPNTWSRAFDFVGKEGSRFKV
jgi:hypothetical protein